nr:MAG TPA: hypothetical protein [Caudoviricetes sp.]
MVSYGMPFDLLILAIAVVLAVTFYSSVVSAVVSALALIAAFSVSTYSLSAIVRA